GIEGIIGPNGAGKTTLMNVITHTRRPDSGTITYRPERDGAIDITSLKPDQIARLGVVKSNQVITEFDSLTIRDSMLLSAAQSHHERFWRLSAERELRTVSRDELATYLDYFQIDEPDSMALSAGDKKLLDIIRCLVLKPRFLLMDEPTAGLPEDQTKRVMELMQRKASEEDVSIVIVEHDLALIWEVCEFVHFMSDGVILEQGPPERIRNSKAVAQKYLGSSDV
ncbi:MAG: ABC transporter ATP-binding protein, partial [Chloroflexota bacterium]